MSLLRGDNLSTSTFHAAKTSSDDPNDDFCTCGYPTFSAKISANVSNPLEPLCAIYIAARDAFRRKKTKKNMLLGNIDDKSLHTDEPKCKKRKMLTAGQKLQMFELFESKIEVREIAWRFACVERTVYKVIEKASDLQKEAKPLGYDDKKMILRPGFRPELHVSFSRSEFMLHDFRDCFRYV